MKKQITTQEKTPINFVLGEQYEMSNVIDILKKSKVEIFYFDFNKNNSISVVKKAIRMETDLEEKQREVFEIAEQKQKEEIEKNLYLSLKKKFEPK